MIRSPRPPGRRVASKLSTGAPKRGPSGFSIDKQGVVGVVDGKAPQSLGRLSVPPPQELDRLGRATELCPPERRPSVQAIHDRPIGASIEQQLKTPERVVLRSQMQRARVAPLLSPPETVTQIGVGSVVQKPRSGLDLVRIASPQQRRSPEGFALTFAPRDTSAAIDSH